MYALGISAKREAQRQKWEEYVADCVAAITTRLFRMSGAEDFSVPLFSEMISAAPKENEMSAEEIRQKVLGKLEGRR